MPATKSAGGSSGLCKDETLRAKTTDCFVRVGFEVVEGQKRRRDSKSNEERMPSPISILIELNATSYLMPGTRQKLKLNGHAVPLYLSVHSSRLAVRSSADAHRLSVLEFTRETRSYVSQTAQRAYSSFLDRDRCRFPRTRAYNINRK